MKKRRWLIVSFPVLLILGVYFLGPKPAHPVYDETLPTVPANPDELESYLETRENAHLVKPDNEARIVWNDDSLKNKTEFAIVYLHGFSASQKEGDPVHRRFAEEFGANLLLTRLADHGIDTTDALYHFTADRVWETAKEALAIGEALGEKVIVMGTSTGATLGLMMAAKYPQKIHALINLSPNVAINDPAAFILNDPWGLQIARLVMGGNYRETEATEEESKYWNARYRLESLVQLEELVETSMTRSTFQRITHPVLTLYYYKNEQEQDPQVKVSAMLEMNDQLATPASLKVAKAIPEAGAHVIGCSLTSGDVAGVYAEIENFARQKLGMRNAAVAGLDDMKSRQ